jgi:5-methylcytosine-specific restriction enzyme A
MTRRYICRKPFCQALVEEPGLCKDHRNQRDREYYAKRAAQGRTGWYSTPEWKANREAYLRQHPFCECEVCKKALASGERPDEAQVLDHIIPHEGDESLFWDPRNWQAMSKRHHDRKTATEDGGFGRESARDALRGEAG